MGLLAWPPGMFWQATVADLQAALTGLRQKQGGGAVLEEDDVAALQALLAKG